MDRDDTSIGKTRDGKLGTVTYFPDGSLVTRTGTTANLTWTAPSVNNATSVLIQRSTNGYAWTTIETISGSSTSYSNSSLSSGLRYYYRVYYANSVIDSSPSVVEYIEVP